RVDIGKHAGEIHRFLVLKPESGHARGEPGPDGCGPFEEAEEPGWDDFLTFTVQQRRIECWIFHGWANGCFLFLSVEIEDMASNAVAIAHDTPSFLNPHFLRRKIPAHFRVHARLRESLDDRDQVRGF